MNKQEELKHIHDGLQSSEAVSLAPKKDLGCDALELTDRLIPLPQDESVCSVASLKELADVVASLDLDLKKTWFVFDIDQTLLRPCAPEARSKMVFQHWPAFKARIPPLTLEQRDMLFNAAMATLDVELMEPETAAFLKHLQEQGAATLALTASLSGAVLNYPAFSMFRFDQCSSLGFQFSNLLDTEDWSFPFELYWNGVPRYYRGILSCNGAHVGFTKGDVFAAFLKQCPAEKRPDFVVFADDTRRHIVTMHETLKTLDMAHRCFEYTHYQADPAQVSEEAFVRYWQALYDAIKPYI